MHSKASLSLSVQTVGNGGYGSQYSTVPIIRPIRTDAWSKNRKCQIQLKTSLEKFPIPSTHSSACYTKLSRAAGARFESTVRFSAIPVTVLICDYEQRCYRLQNCDERVVWLRRIKRNVGYSGLHFTSEYII